MDYIESKQIGEEQNNQPETYTPEEYKNIVFQATIAEDPSILVEYIGRLRAHMGDLYEKALMEEEGGMIKGGHSRDIAETERIKEILSARQHLGIPVETQGNVPLTDEEIRRGVHSHNRQHPLGSDENSDI